MHSMKNMLSLKHTVSIIKCTIMKLSSLSSSSPPIDGSIPMSGPILRIIMIIGRISIVVLGILIIGTIILTTAGYRRRPEDTQFTTVGCTAVDVETTTSTTTCARIP